MQKQILLLILIVLFNFVQKNSAMSCENESKISANECCSFQTNVSSVDFTEALIEKDGSLLVNKKHSDCILQNEQTSLLEDFIYKLKAISSISGTAINDIENQVYDKKEESIFFLSSIRASNRVSFLTCCNFRI
jgi:hypothetical protein